MRSLITVLAFVALAGCWPEAEPEVLRVSGDTMGTTYHVTVVDPSEDMNEAALQDLVDTTLVEINGVMSNWVEDSEVSRFNRSLSTDEIAISEDLSAVMEAAAAVNRLSGGKFDVTLSPLIDLWGFGTKAPGDPLPDEDSIANAMTLIGQDRVLQYSDGAMRKTAAGVSINLSAIAKGYGIDKVAAALAAAGNSRYLVEIGGDLVAHGHNPEDQLWSIGIESPDAASRQLQRVVPLPDKGLATSGDYRNYFEEDGVRYSHIIDPTTGRPVTHTTASVTVIAENAMMADGLATALLVVGGDDAMRIAEANDIAVFLIRREGNEFVTAESRAFSALIDDKG